MGKTGIRKPIISERLGRKRITWRSISLYDSAPLSDRPNTRIGNYPAKSFGLRSHPLEAEAKYPGTGINTLLLVPKVIEQQYATLPLSGDSDRFC